MPTPLCEHVMSSGIRCGSPAQRGQKHCFYHTSIGTLLPKRFIGHENFRNEYEHGCRLFPMPLLEDATSIQTALMQVIHATLEGAIHFRSASIVLSALRTAQRNLALVKLEMAATSAAAMERELPSDARQKAEMAWPNRADDEWPTSYLGEATVSPAHLNGDLGYREPKIPPEAEDESAGQAGTAERSSADGTNAGAAAAQGDHSSTADGMDTFTAARLAARRAARPSTDSTIAGMGRLPGTDNARAASSSTSAGDAGAGSPPQSADAGGPAVSPAHLNGDLGCREPKIPPDPEGEPASQAAAAADPAGAPPDRGPQRGPLKPAQSEAEGPSSGWLSPAVGERVATDAALPARKQPLPFPAGSPREQAEPRQEEHTQTERSD